MIRIQLAGVALMAASIISLIAALALMDWPWWGWPLLIGITALYAEAIRHERWMTRARIWGLRSTEKQAR